MGAIGDGRGIDWELLVRRIGRGDCTPFVGAGASAPPLPLGGDLAEAWASEHQYPLTDTRDLARVAQYLAVTKKDWVYPKDLVLDALREQLGEGDAPPDPPEVYGLLARFPLKVYLTTNYDSFLVEALRRAGRRPQVDFVRWNSYLRNHLYDFPSVLADGFRPTVDEPLVYHLHGLVEERQSLVVTEDDYLGYLVAIAEDDDLLPSVIQGALAGTSLLFIGYSLRDWTFRVVFKGLVLGQEQSLTSQSVAVQLPDTDDAAVAYWTQYWERVDIQVYWGDAAAFTAELSDQWDARGGR